MQKFLAAIVFIFIFSSCSDHSKNSLAVFKATEEGLSVANQMIYRQTNFLYRSLEDKLADPRTHEQAAVWQPKAENIKELSSEMTNYIGGLKNDLIKEAGFKKENDQEVYREDDMGSVTRIFGAKGKGDELYKKLEKYKEDMLGTDERIKSEFGNNVILTTRSFDSSPNEHKDLTRSFFTGIPMIAALAMLSKFENNVKIMENDFVTYCFYHINTGYDGYDRFTVMIGQSSTYVKGGEPIEINAGIGAFSRAANPQVTINNKSIAVNESAVANYTFKTPLKAGKYAVPVKIEYLKPDGTRETVKKNISYTVGE